MTRGLGVIAVLSGCAALVFETLWFRVAGLVLGTGVWASSIVLAAFMLGLAAGNWLAGRLGDRIRSPLRCFAALELAIGGASAAVVLGLPALALHLAPLLGGLRGIPEFLLGVRALLALALVSIPATAMGATLPVLVKARCDRGGRFGAALGKLYGWNTAGAVIGALLGEAWWIGWLGIPGTALAAASLDAAAAAAALWLARRLEAPGAPAPPASATEDATVPGARALRLLTASFLAGALFLALEVVWFRFLSLFIHGSSLLFAVMLAVLLSGIALGGLAAGRWLEQRERSPAWLPLLALAPGVLALLCFRSFSDIFDLLVAPTTGAADPFGVVLLALPLTWPTALLSGALFTALGDAAKRELGGASRTTGFVTLANTLGSALGALAAGFALLPHVGVEGSLLALALGYGVVAACAWLPAPDALRLRAAAGMVGGALVLFAAAFPFGVMRSKYLEFPTRSFRKPDSEVVAIREGRTQTLVYTRTRRFGHPYHFQLFTDGFSMSGTATYAKRYMKAYVYLPAALHPRLESALLISYGVGSTAKALVDNADLERIDVVDISAEILEMSDLVHPNAAENPLRDRRVRVHVEDGRFFLATTRRRFDLITGEPPPPKLAGVVNLYTREYFQLMRERLNEGGFASYWLPVHSLALSDARAIVRAFCDVFEDCTLWSGSGFDWMLVGTRNSAGGVDFGHFTRQWRDPRVGSELRALGFELPEQLGTSFLAGSASLRAFAADTPPLVDAHPQRLSPRLPTRTDPVRTAGFRALMDPRRARDEFSRSRFVERHWPAELRESTLAWFDSQALVNALLLAESPGAPVSPGLAELHQVLSETTLRTLALWILGSDEFEQRIAERAARAGVKDPSLQVSLGVGALADRDYASAAAWFGRARRKVGMAADLAQVEIYALCRAGRAGPASALARQLARASVRAPGATPWPWLQEICGAPDSPGSRQAGEAAPVSRSYDPSGGAKASRASPGSDPW